MPLLRLDKLISDSGIASRREALSLIKCGRVTVDGIIAASGSEKLDPESVKITVDGELIEYTRYRYLMLNKPAGFITATEDPNDRTVMELLSDRDRKLGLFPAGRLDKDTEGLLLLTNDGDFAHRVMSPAKKVTKRYYARLSGVINESDELAFSRGLTLGDGTKCLPAVLEDAGDGGVYITLQEGKYHQVKRMAAAIGKPVQYLKRIAIGGLALEGEGKNLALGEYRTLSDFEIDAIFTER